LALAALALVVFGAYDSYPSHTCLDIKAKLAESVIWLFFKISLSTNISMKRSHRELSIDIVIHRGIFKHNQITLFPRFTIILKPGVSFYCERLPKAGSGARCSPSIDDNYKARACKVPYMASGEQSICTGNSHTQRVQVLFRHLKRPSSLRFF